MRKLGIAGALALSCFMTASVAAAQVNYGDIIGTNVNFLQVTETTSTAGDPAVLWGAPALAGGGDQLVFFPPNFTSTCAAGSSDVTGSQLQTTISAPPNNTIQTIELAESGDVTLTRFPPFGDPTTNANASLSGFVTVLETISGPIVPVVIPFAGTFNPSSTFSLPGDFGTSIWSGQVTIDVVSVVPNATRAVLSLDNDLATNCGAGASSGKIQKKTVSGPSVAIAINQPPCVLQIDKTCCVPTPTSPGIDICDGKAVRAVFEVVSGGCGDITNPQEGKAKCTGMNPVLAPTDTVSVTVLEDEDEITVNGVLGGATGIPVGSQVVIANADSGDDLKSNTELRVSGPGGSQDLEIHTSCSKSLSCGDQFGSLKLVALETTEGGNTICPTAEPDGTSCTPPQGQLGVECEERPSEIVFEYTGSACQNPLPQSSSKASCSGNPNGANNVSVIYTGKDPGKFTLTPNSGIDVGESFAFTATGRDDLQSESTFKIQGPNGVLQSIKLHTSCSQPLRCGDEFGALKIVEFTQKDGVKVSCDTDPGPLFQTACEVPLAPPTPHCTSKVLELQLAYIGDVFGEGCAVSNSQGGNASCVGVADPGTPVSVTVTKDPGEVFATPNSGINAPTNTSVDVVSFTRIDNGDPKELDKDTEFDVSGPGGTQSISIRTSCSKPLNLGDRFGSFAVVGLDREDDGFVGLGGQVEYQFTVTNPNATDATGVAIVDDPLGPITSGQTVPAGQSKTFFVTKTVLQSFIDTATVTGNVDGGMCTPAVSNEVNTTVSLPPQGSFDCSDAKPIDGLSMVWNGAGNICVVAYDGTAGSSPVLKTKDNVAPNDVVTVTGMGGSPNDQQWRIYAAGNCGGAVIGTSQFHISCSDSNMNGIEDCGRDQGNGKSDEAGLVNTWKLEGIKGSGASLDCTPDPISTPGPTTCGLGFELAMVLPGLMWLGRRRWRRAD